MSTITIPVGGCSHVGADMASGYRGLARHIEDIYKEMPDFPVMIRLGDDSGQQTEVTEAEGRELVGQTFHRGADVAHRIYAISGNHDREKANDNSLAWFRKWVDPLGENTEFSGINNNLRPYPIDGTAERYKFELTGTNLVFLMMGDMNRPVTGKRAVGGYGGDPAGVVSQSTFDWWKAQVESYRNTDKIVITCHHYLLRDTTTCTGYYEGGSYSNGVYTQKFHGPGLHNGKYSGFLAFVDESEDDTQFIDHLTAHPGDTQLWLGAHSHCKPGHTTGGKSLAEYRADLGCTFINCASLTKTHGPDEHLYPRCRLLKFTHGSSIVSVDNYYHTNKDPYERGFSRGRDWDIGKPFLNA